MLSGFVSHDRCDRETLVSVVAAFKSVISEFIQNGLSQVFNVHAVELYKHVEF